MDGLVLGCLVPGARGSAIGSPGCYAVFFRRVGSVGTR